MGKQITDEEIKEKTKATSERIKQFRKNLGKTQEEMAVLAELNFENYKKIEEGSNSMSMASLRKIQKALEVSFDYLLDGQAESADQLWYKVNACDDKECMKILVKIIKKVSNVEFEEWELANLVADVHKDSYGNPENT